ncbi:TraB/GumN family protein [Methylotuvimicrobium buryatense]|uniref:TraB/GumN family protein n=1 Tax=Methylotuvimicrobium buryatense TaxID=95641 RepID=A0A4P9UTV2_METBY|nr:TraB/GumN family protein [Methylotuvimicrobium buryatense]QCW84060.1 TraB/GumN family protein [Methylotuvimicrobium buryatense]
MKTLKSATHYKVICSFFALALLIAGPVCSETSLWRVSKGDTELFIGGTIHLLSASDYPLPEAFERVYRKADKLVLEVDLTDLSGQEVQITMMRRLQYVDGTTLRDELNAETYAELERFCRHAGIAIESLQNLKPPLAAISLMMFELHRLGLAEAGVDHFFSAKAQSDNKPVGALESLEMQISVLEQMGRGQENELILSTLRDIQELPALLSRLKSAWRSGDLDTLDELGIAPMRSDYPSLYRELLVNRNNAWVPKIETMLSTPERELILVGVLHLAGEEGVLRQLCERGYVVEPYRPFPINLEKAFCHENNEE